MEGSLCFKIDCASLIVGSKLTVFAYFSLYLRAISKYKLGGGGAYIRRGNLTEDFWRYKFEGLIFGGAYFRNFTVRPQSEFQKKGCFVY